MLIYIVDIRKVFDTITLEFNNFEKVYIQIAMSMGGHSIDINVNEHYVKDELKPHVLNFVRLIYNNIIVGYLDTVSNEQTYNSLLSEIGEYINHLKNNKFETLEFSKQGL